ncbi:MAG: hypothetical protein ACYCPQ_01865 [Elusimicrobiota bacterium]
MKKTTVAISLILLWSRGSAAIIAAPIPKTAFHLRISSTEALSAGKKIWNNECGGSVQGLTHWNHGEDFASLGIGHFIWYPKDRRGPFIESFPPLLEFMKKNKVAIPGWLLRARACPWKNKREFDADSNSPRMTDLRALLAATTDVQARFMARRLESALPKMLAELSSPKKKRVRRNFMSVLKSHGGLYPLMDYVNFKGEGTARSERYHGQGWGLLQVLVLMRPAKPGPAALAAFSQAAKTTLARRVKNSPRRREEKLWLPVWERRVASYAAQSR